MDNLPSPNTMVGAIGFVVIGVVLGLRGDIPPAIAAIFIVGGLFAVWYHSG